MDANTPLATPLDHAANYWCHYDSLTACTSSRRHLDSVYHHVSLRILHYMGDHHVIAQGSLLLGEVGGYPVP